MDNRDTPNKVGLFRDIVTVRRNWQYFLGLGIILVILGILAISFSVLSTGISVVFLGIILLGAGIAQFVQCFMARTWNGTFLALLLGILYIVTGALCVFRPLESAVSLTLLIAAFCLVGGLFRILAPLFIHIEHWGWILFNGVITFILGLLILSNWPFSGLWVIGLFVGIDMILIGWTWIMLSLTARPKNTSA